MCVCYSRQNFLGPRLCQNLHRYIQSVHSNASEQYANDDIELCDSRGLLNSQIKFPLVCFFRFVYSRLPECHTIDNSYYNLILCTSRVLRKIFVFERCIVCNTKFQNFHQKWNDYKMVIDWKQSENVYTGLYEIFLSQTQKLVSVSEIYWYNRLWFLRNIYLCLRTFSDSCQMLSIQSWQSRYNVREYWISYTTDVIIIIYATRT